MSQCKVAWVDETRLPNGRPYVRVQTLCSNGHAKAESRDEFLLRFQRQFGPGTAPVARDWVGMDAPPCDICRCLESLAPPANPMESVDLRRVTF